MSERFVMPPPRLTTQAAEGLPRWRWTVAELERLDAAGFFTEYDRIELLGGEIVPTPSWKERAHEVMREELAFCMMQHASNGMMAAPGPQFNLSADTYFKPDILVHARAVRSYDLRGAEALLVIEVADGATLDYDLKTKMSCYAVHGVPEYWVVNTLTRVTTIHRQPAGNIYVDKKEFPPTERLIPSLAPTLAVSLNELDLD
jgi:Uma2 family endonuclease